MKFSNFIEFSSPRLWMLWMLLLLLLINWKWESKIENCPFVLAIFFFDYRQYKTLESVDGLTKVVIHA